MNGQSASKNREDLGLLWVSVSEGGVWTRRFLDRFLFHVLFTTGDILDAKQAINGMGVVVEMRSMILSERRKEVRMGEG